MAKTTQTGAQYAGMKRQPKPVNAQQLYRTLHDQLDQQHLEKGLKTCEKREQSRCSVCTASLTPSAVLRLDSADTLATHTQVQLLVALDRYPEALALLSPDSDKLTRAYCLYKTGRETEAQQTIGQLGDEEREDRAAKLLEAQVVSC